MYRLIIFTIASLQFLVNPASTGDQSKFPKRNSLPVSANAEDRVQDLVVSMSTGELLTLLQKQGKDQNMSRCTVTITPAYKIKSFTCQATQSDLSDFSSSDPNLIRNALEKGRQRDEQRVIVNRLMPIYPAPQIDLDDLKRALHKPAGEKTPEDPTKYDNFNNNNNILSVTY